MEDDCSEREVRSSLQAQHVTPLTSPRNRGQYSKQDKVLNLRENLQLSIKY